MKIDHTIAFVGPSWPEFRLDQYCNLDVYPPAKRGDIYLAALEEPRVILLLDGSFEETPAVFHKEILFALAKGIHVLGSSSLGAIRAAELHAFGMVGIGAIFEWYRDGTLRRDDAVAVLHGPAELGWPSITTSLVDIEENIGLAFNAGVIRQGEADLLRDCAGHIFWKERTSELLLKNAVSVGLEGKTLRALEHWFSSQWVSRKQKDAVTLASYVNQAWEGFAEPFSPSFNLEETSAWRRFQVEMRWRSLKIEPEVWERVRSFLAGSGIYEEIEMEALCDIVVKENAELTGQEIPEATQRLASEYREARGLSSAEQVQNWMSNGAMSHADYAEIISQYGMRKAALRASRKKLPAKMVSVLQRKGILRGIL